MRLSRANIPLASEDRTYSQAIKLSSHYNLAPHFRLGFINLQHFCHSRWRNPVRLSKSGQSPTWPGRIFLKAEKWKTCNIRWMNQDGVPINEVGTRDEDEGAAPQAPHRQGLVIQPCASAYSDIHFFFDEIDRAIGGDDLHADQGVVCQEAGHDPRKPVLGKARGTTDPDCADGIGSQ